MIKLIGAVFIASTFTGCFYQVTDKTDILKAQDFCKDKIGVKDIRVDFTSGEIVECLNGKSKSLDFHKLKQ